jgi:predicted DsbA family dithiol-disulfide isomerase
VAQQVAAPVHIDVISDVVCPWCFLGKRRLDAAVRMVPEVPVRVLFRPFFLDPTIPREGMSRRDYLEGKFGKGDLAGIHDQLIAAGKAEGVPYKFELITRSPNSLNAHRLLRWAAVAGTQPQVLEALFMAYWSWGQDIGDIAVLKTIAIVNGFRGEDIERVLKSDEGVTEVRAEVAMAEKMGVSGVPTFIFNNKYGVVGAQPAEVLVNVIRKAAADGGAAQG